MVCYYFTTLQCLQLRRDERLCLTLNELLLCIRHFTYAIIANAQAQTREAVNLTHSFSSDQTEGLPYFNESKTNPMHFTIRILLLPQEIENAANIMKICQETVTDSKMLTS